MDRVPDTIYILAGEHRQYMRFRRQLIDTLTLEGLAVRYNDIHYVDNVDQLKGLERGSLWGYRVGTWADRPDLEELKLVLATNGSSIENFIEVEMR